MNDIGELPNGWEQRVSRSNENKMEKVDSCTDSTEFDVPVLRLTDQVVRNFRLSKIFRENSSRINSMSFNDAGDLLISSGDDESIIIYDCMQGTSKKALNSKKYGVDLINYTHAANTAIHASTKVDDTIRYLSLHDNKYIRYFAGHSDRVNCLMMSPTDDTFLSTSVDQTLRLWDLRSPNCQGLMHLTGRTIANFDPDGLIFAAGVSSDKVKLYDLRSFDKGPFSTFRICSSVAANEPVNSSFSSAGSTISTNSTSNGFGPEWLGLRFSPDGRVIALLSADEQIKLIDAFHGTLLHCLTTESSASANNNISNPLGSQTRYNLPQNVTFSPDSQFIFCGATDGSIHSWDVKSGRKLAVYTSQHVGTVCHVEFNPKYMMMASTCTNMIFWLPDPDEL
ncbi:hypothetical protein GJ496_000869 [Pomphorhynchus laevis]|nr:hypothetical protein GJ496_000869 [Pomphorhynchus laevis]